MNKYRGTCIHTVYNRGRGDRGPQTDKHLPPSTFTGQFLRKADIWVGVFIDTWSMPLLYYQFPNITFLGDNPFNVNRANVRKIRDSGTGYHGGRGAGSGEGHCLTHAAGVHG